MDLPSDIEPSSIGAVCWFRRDLRVGDNAALAASLEYVRAVRKRVLAVFVFDSDILDHLPDRDDRRMAFIAESVAALDECLRRVGGGLLVLQGSARRVMPALVAELGGIPVFASGDHEHYGLARDVQVGRELSTRGSSLEIVQDLELIPAGRILTGSGTPFRVFTPFFRAWSAYLEREMESVLGVRDSIPRRGEVAFVGTGQDADALLGRIGFRRGAGATTAGGEASATTRLAGFLPRLGRYGEERDFPGLAGTSGLSVDLRFGTISVRELVRRARERPGSGGEKWISEIAWRDFYQSVLHHFPETVDRAFQSKLERVVWDDPETDPVAGERFEAWKQGRTGYPFVDAAMRELRATGRMHNRCRMVVASFLTKDLHIHWKRGERWFARWLLDIELASNVGGWQWAASTGADGQPWFRVFNPVEQGRRWDPSGVWTRDWCPELAHLPDKWLHSPWEAPAPELEKAGVRLGREWPRPVVDHGVERLETLARFGRISGG